MGTCATLHWLEDRWDAEEHLFWCLHLGADCQPKVGCSCLSLGTQHHSWPYGVSRLPSFPAAVSDALAGSFWLTQGNSPPLPGAELLYIHTARRTATWGCAEHREQRVRADQISPAITHLQSHSPSPKTYPPLLQRERRELKAGLCNVAVEYVGVASVQGQQWGKDTGMDTAKRKIY